MLEKRLIAVSPQSFIADGGSDGLISVNDTSLFKVKQEVIITATSLPTLDQIEIKRIINSNVMFVGPKGGNIDSRINVSAYTLILSAKISANEQKRPSIPFEEYTRAVYDEEPIVADRVVSVDKHGQYYTVDNPLPVQLSDGSLNIGTVNAELEVQLSHKDGYPNTGDVADSVRIGDGTETLAINADGSINANATVTANNLDIRDLTFATDKVDVSGSNVNATVTANNLDIRDLNHTQDSIKIGDGIDFLAINSDGSINTNTEISATDGDNIGLQVQQRNLTPDDTKYNKKVTAVTGSGTYGDTTSLDVSLHDQNGNAYTTLNPLPVNSTAILNKLSAPLDFFGNQSVSIRTNQIEVQLDDINWTNFIDAINVSTGSASQANGQVTLTTGTNANGRYAIISKDFVKYRPNSEVGWGFTWAFPTVSIIGVTLRIGATDDATTWANSVFFSHEDGIFSLKYSRNGTIIFSAQRSSWLDPCNGAAGSAYVDFAGNPVVMDISKDQLSRIRAGLFGHAGFIVEILAPNQTWVTIYRHTNINDASVPVFSNFDLKVAAEVKKVAAGSGVYTLSSACWAGWAGSQLIRLSDPISDRSLTQITRTIIEGKSSSGGGTFIPVKVNPSGSLEVSLGDIAGVTGQDTMANSLPVTIASDQTPVDAGVVLGDQYTPNIPDTGTTQTRLLTDPDNQLKIRGNMLTDEGTYRDDFSGISLSPDWVVSTNGSASYSVGSSLLTLSSGVTSGNRVTAVYAGDYGPISLRTNFSISNRSANQVVTVGFQDSGAGAYFEFTGTNNTQLRCITQSSTDPTDFQITAINYFNGSNSSQSHEYYIEVQPDQVSFLLDQQLIAQHRLHLPGPYDVVDLNLEVLNTGAATNTNIVFDYIYLINQDSIQINNSFDGDSLPIRQKTGFISTYAAATANFTYAANGTDIFTITGSNSKVVKIKHISVDGTQTATATRTVSLIKRSSQNVGGTFTNLTAVPYDSFNESATATVRYYTANPTTLGTTVGALHTEKLIIPSTGATVEDSLVWSTIEATTMQDITLRSSNEVLALNFGGVTSAGNLMNVDVVWTEE